MNKLVKLLVIISLTGLLAACTAADQIQEDNLPLAVTTTQATSQVIEENFHTVGRVVPLDTYVVRPGLQGQVVDVLVASGDQVNQGDLLYVIDNDTAQNTLTSTESSLRSVLVGLRLQAGDLEKQLADTQSLFEAGAASQAEVNRLESQLASVKIQVNDAAVNYSNQIASLKDAASAGLVTSPATGFVGTMSLKMGDTLSGQEEVLIIDDSSFLVQTALTADQLRLLKDVLTIDVWVEGQPDQVIKAQIDTIDYVQNTQTGMFHVHLSLAASDFNLYDGEYVEVVFKNAPQAASFLPVLAVRRQEDQTFVYYLENSQVKKAAVSLGAIRDNLIQVSSNIRGLDIILEGADRVKEGQVVTVKAP